MTRQEGGKREGTQMTEREKMLAGELYDCGDKELLDRWHRAKNLVRDYNQTDSENMAEKDRILGELLGGRGANLWITAPFYVDYGNNIYFGNNCEVNLNLSLIHISAKPFRNRYSFEPCRKFPVRTQVP